MAKLDLESYLTIAEKNTALYEEQNFEQRAGVLDFLEFAVAEQFLSQKYQAEKLKTALEAIDLQLFQKLRTEICTNSYKKLDFGNLVTRYVDLSKNKLAPDYDNLDLFINGLLSCQPLPEQTKELEAEMVYFQKTPARVVFELAKRVNFTRDDVFFDLGSGMGQVAILIHLLTGVIVRGIEFEPAFCNYAQDCAIELNLPQVTFVNTDARKADYSDGTVFFMFTPFGGEILQSVLEVLKKESLQRKIKLITYGPCTAQVALQSWLEFIPRVHYDAYQLAFFNS